MPKVVISMRVVRSIIVDYNNMSVLYTRKNELVDILKQKRSDHFNEYKRVYRCVNVFNRMRGGSTGVSYVYLS